MGRVNVFAVIGFLLWAALGAWGIETLIARYPTAGGYMLPFVFGAWLLVPYLAKWAARPAARPMERASLAEQKMVTMKVVRLSHSQADQVIHVIASKHLAVPHTGLVVTTIAHGVAKGFEDEPVISDASPVGQRRSSPLIWAN